MATNLPVEIWETICCEIEIKDIASLNRACRTTHAATLFKLYEYISPEASWNEHSLYRFPPGNHGTKYLSSLVLGLLRHPEVRFKVKGIFLRLCSSHNKNNYCQSSWNAKHLQWTEDEFTMAEAAIRTKNDLLERAADLVNEIRFGSQDGFTALALALVPRVSSIVLGENSMRRRSIFVVPLITKMGESFRQKSDAPLFKYLERLACCTEECELNFLPDPEAFKALFYFPKLEKLSATIHEPHSFVWPGHIVPVSSIKDLTLRFSEIRPNKIEAIIAAVPGLESLSYSYVVYPNVTSDAAPDGIDQSDWTIKYGSWEESHRSWPRLLGLAPAAFNLTDLIAALTLTVSSLKSLTLRLETEYTYHATGFPERLEDVATGSLRGMQDFRVLKAVDIPGHLIMNGDVDLAEVLPSQSLETLYIGSWSTARGFTNIMTEFEYLTYLEHYLMTHYSPTRQLHIGIVDAFQAHDNKVSEQMILKHIRFCKERKIPFSLHSNVPRNTMFRCGTDHWIPSFNSALRGLKEVEEWWLQKILSSLSKDIAWQQGIRHVHVSDRQLFYYAAGLNLSHYGWHYVESDRAFERMEQ